MFMKAPKELHEQLTKYEQLNAEVNHMFQEILDQMEEFSEKQGFTGKDIVRFGTSECPQGKKLPNGTYRCNMSYLNYRYYYPVEGSPNFLWIDYHFDL